jgi:hypothetical protein
MLCAITLLGIEVGESSPPDAGRVKLCATRATLDGIEARYGRSPVRERLREQLERWPER